MKHLIIEGLTGAGKSTVIAELLKKISPNRWEIIYEEETFGELLHELAEEETSGYQKCFRLRNVLDKVESGSGKPFLLERFHPSY